MPLRRHARSAFQRFAQSEASGGLFLMASAAIGMLVANSAFAPNYSDILHTKVGGLDALHWINDGLMALFFLLVGLEIKRETAVEKLDTWSRRALPSIGAFGGMLAPALVFVLVNWQTPETLRGWAVPTATDIAFALGVLSLCGSRVPNSLEVFLTSLAIIDDLGAILIIAIFFRPWAVLACAWDRGTYGRSVGSAQSPKCNEALALSSRWPGVMDRHVVLGHPRHACRRRPGDGHSYRRRPRNERGEVALAPTSNMGLPPGSRSSFCRFSAFQCRRAARRPWHRPAARSLSLGIVLGLFIGKQLGIMAAVFFAVRLGIARLPEQATMLEVYGVRHSLRHRLHDQSFHRLARLRRSHPCGHDQARCWQAQCCRQSAEWLCCMLPKRFERTDH